MKFGKVVSTRMLTYSFNLLKRSGQQCVIQTRHDWDLERANELSGIKSGEEANVWYGAWCTTSQKVKAYLSFLWVVKVTMVEMKEVQVLYHRLVMKFKANKMSGSSKSLRFQSHPFNAWGWNPVTLYYLTLSRHEPSINFGLIFRALVH